MSDGGVPARLSAVTIGARDFGRLRAFYRGLGWRQVQPSPDDWAGFLLGGTLLAIWSRESLAEEARAEDPGAVWSGMTLACNVETPDAVDAAYERAVALGAEPVDPPRDRDWGGRSAYFADPEGNRWEIAYAPGVEFDERGALTKFGD